MNRVLVTAGCLLGVFCCSASVLLGETRLTPSAGVRTTYDDHILGKDDADFEVLLTPGFKLDTGSERTKFQISGQVDAYQYAENDEFERENAQLNFSASHATTERLTFRLGTQWLRDHSVENEYDESGIVTNLAARNTYSATPGFSYAVTERDEFSLDTSLSTIRYEESGNINYHVAGGSSGWSHALGDGLWRIIGQLGMQTFTFDRDGGATKQTVTSTQGGLAWKASELLEFQAMGGVSRTDSDVTFDNSAAADIDEARTTFSGSLSGVWTDEVWRLTLTADRSESPSTYGELITRNRLRTTFGRNLSERLYLGLQGAWYQSKTKGLVEGDDTSTWNVGPSLRYRTGQDSFVEGGYSFIHQEELESGDSTDRNRANVNFVIEFPSTF